MLPCSAIRTATFAEYLRPRATSPIASAWRRNFASSRVYLRGLIESSVDGLITVDPTGFHHRRERTDVPHDGLHARGTNRFDIQAVFHRARPGGFGRQAHSDRSDRHELRTRSEIQDGPQSHGFLQRLDLPHTRRTSPRHLCLGARHLRASAARPATRRTAGL